MNDRTARKLLLIPAVVALVRIAVGCSDTPSPKTDLDESNLDLVETPWTVYGNYDEFPNVAVKCDGSTRMYTTTRVDSALLLVPEHELCQDGQR